MEIVSVPQRLNVIVSRFREYVSSHGASIQRTKQFLERESRRVMERQAALQAAQSTSQDPGLRGATEESRRTLQQVELFQQFDFFFF